MKLVEVFSGTFVARVCAFDASVKCRGPARGPSEEWLTARPENSSWWKTAASIGPMRPLLPKSPGFSPPEQSPDVPQSSCIWCIWGIWTLCWHCEEQKYARNRCMGTLEL